ncbi:aldehyde dehydrogenase [Vibrio inusitatus NBRC 102082]|uniref:Aldehyde dehydrogenase n=1 Tax=Vibrio inusitatus NBRC 102082 TaxID=1219070 RepID=A0A4Y3HSY0_9VIBR|nr:coniferyl aldehyde dehydrogenase [Vibrio inusitatus]GEA50259.1 aldehyde dehydrogenase [Vibrio inusitatus NBRC 102082]
MGQLNLVSDDIIKKSDDLTLKLEQLKSGYSQEPSPSIELRKQRLLLLKQSIVDHEKQLIAALSKDFGFRSDFDSVLTDIIPTINHIKYTVKNLSKWARPSKRHAGLMLMPSKLRVEYQPVGVVGIISPWNFPIILSLSPVATAIAAGNKAMLKLSEFTPNTNEVIENILSVIDEEVFVVQGGAEIARSFSSLRFDHLLFTGSTQVGRLVAQAAAKNLTPVTLELGGKSPVIIAPDAQLEKIVDVVLFGKCVNAGQICVAPDYVLIEQERADEFAELFIKRFNDYFGKDLTQFSHIINGTQYRRLQSYLEQARDQESVRVVPVAENDNSENGYQILPHLVFNPSDDLDIMKEEIFGPILPIITYEKVEQAVEYVNDRERPLALYIMSDDSQCIDYVLNNTHSGGVCINDTIFHVAAEDAPFGGIGHSGIGHYHGEEGFRTFSHARTVLHTPSWLPRTRLLMKYRKSTLSVMKKVFGK